MRLLLILFAFVTHSWGGDVAPGPQPALSPLYVLLKGRCVKFSVEIADSAVMLQKGLMLRNTLPKEQGMLFVFPEEQRWSMWMENTHIPLDMIFVDVRGIVKHIQHQATPKSLSMHRPPSPVKFVLEIAGGLSQKMNLQVGDTIVHDRIGNVPPKLCQTAQVISQVLQPTVPPQLPPAKLSSQKKSKARP